MNVYRQLVLLACVLSGVASAESFYKWVDDQGVTHYSQSPPSGGRANTIDIELAPAQQAPAIPRFHYTPASDKSVVIYTAKWCGVCKSAKGYFRDHDIGYTEYDIETSAKGRADYQRMGGRGVPIVMIGSQRMDGFSASRFAQMMK
jgi:glutaredoxin